VRVLENVLVAYLNLEIANGRTGLARPGSGVKRRCELLRRVSCCEVAIVGISERNSNHILDVFVRASNLS
jgi:hypothetical protein